MDRTQKQIGIGSGGSVNVWCGYARDLGDNGLSADAKCTLHIAPAVEDADEYIWMETNGDPLMIGWLEDGQVVLNEAEFVGVGGRVVDMERDEMTWIAEILAQEYGLVV